MKKQAYQKPTLYDSAGKKIQDGAFDPSNDVLHNGTYDGTMEYIANNLEALHESVSSNEAEMEYIANNLEALHESASSNEAELDDEVSARQKADNNLNTTLAKRTAVHLAYVDGDLALVEE